MKSTITSRRRVTRVIPAVLVVAALGLAACGDSDDGDADEPADAGADDTAAADGADEPADEPVGEWVPEQDIEWIVPYSAGGGFDVYSRGLAEVLQSNYLPDGVNIVIQNTTPLPLGITNMFTAEPDGYTVGILPMPAAIAQEIQQPDVAQWTTDEFTFIGSIDENGYVVYVPSDSPFETIEDLVAAEGLGTVTVEEGSSSALAGQATIQALGLDSTVTYGAEGSAEVVTAALRGDADYIVYGSTDLVGFVESGDIRPLLFLGTEDQRPEALTWLADTPSAEEAGYADLAGAVTELRTFVAPPGLPPEVEQWWTTTMADALFSPELEEWATTAERPIVPRDAEDTETAVASQIEQMRVLVPQLSS